MDALIKHKFKSKKGELDKVKSAYRIVLAKISQQDIEEKRLKEEEKAKVYKSINEYNNPEKYSIVQKIKAQIKDNVEKVWVEAMKFANLFDQQRSMKSKFLMHVTEDFPTIKKNGTRIKFNHSKNN